MYTDAHRLVVQAFLANGVMNSEDVKKLIKSACEKCEVTNSNQNVDNFIHQINSKLQKMFMEVRKKREEETGVEVYALVQTSETEVGKLATDFHPKELELFKGIVEKIVTSENGEVPSMDCLNLADGLTRRISKDETQTAMKNFVKERWLFNDEEGQMSLGARGIMELQMFLEESFADYITSCYLCQDIVIKGQLCTECNKVKLHYFCAQRLFQSRPNSKCPSCEKDWVHEIPMLNGAGTDVHQEEAATTSQPSTSGRRQRAARR